MPINPDNFLNSKEEPESFLSEWLHYPESITEKLSIKTGDASIQLLRQGLEMPNWWDKYALDIRKLSNVYTREILMTSYGTPCWYARTIIPEQTYSAQHHLFKKLDKQSLTSLIYNNSDMKRLELMSYAISKDTIEWHWASSFVQESTDQLWARIATYEINKKDNFYLIEIFLPDLKKACHVI